MSNRTHILIIEDELSSANKLQDFLRDIDSNFHVISILSSIEDSINWLEKNKHPALIFLDIHLSDGLSFEIFENRDIQSHVIFLTACEQYAIRAFEINSIDYILKPFTKKDIEQGLKKYSSKTWQTTTLINSQIADLKISAENRKERFLVKKGNKISSIDISQIAYFFKDKLSFLVTVQNEKYLIDYTLDQLDDMLSSKDFFRLNRQFVCHYKSVQSVDRLDNNRLRVHLLPKTKDDIIVSQTKSGRFREWLDL